MSRRSLLVAAVIAAASLPGTSAGDEPRAMVDALVLDGNGNPVPGLSRGDFEITIGDRIHPVSEARIVSAGHETRRFVFVVNRRGARPAQLRRMKAGLEDFMAVRFGDRDEALFVDFAEVPRITRGWRQGRAAALPEVRSITEMGFRSPNGPSADVADASFMLAALAERLREPSGRKVLVLFSGSLSTFAGKPGKRPQPSSGPGAISDAASDSTRSADRALETLAHFFNAANASVYAVHLEGAYRQERGILTTSREEHGGPWGRGMNAFSRPPDDFLSSLASETGGAYTAQATDFARILEGIEQSNRLWYELTFDPSGTGSPGSYQPHEVRVRNRPGLQVVVRPGHVAPY